MLPMCSWGKRGQPPSRTPPTARDRSREREADLAAYRFRRETIASAGGSAEFVRYTSLTVLPRVLMQNLAEVVSTYVRGTRRLESLPSSTDTTFYPDLKLMLNPTLRGELIAILALAAGRHHQQPSAPPSYTQPTCRAG